MHHDGAGLYLRIREGGGASWTLRYKLRGRDPIAEKRATDENV
jgi:hypothetical protein